MKTYLKQHWPQLVLVGLAASVLLWAGGCPPRTPSPIDPTRDVTLAELNVELEHILARFELADADIQEKQRIRSLIMSNALLIAQSGTVNPLGILTAIAGAYGIASAGTDTVKAVKKRKKPPAEYKRTRLTPVHFFRLPMTQSTSKNAFTIRGNLVVIFLDPAHSAMAECADFDKIINFRWRAVRHGRCFYAKTTVGTLDKQVDLSMHRIIAKTPFGMVCHHRNRNSLDNRAKNLINMTKKDHDFLHAGNSLLIKYADNTESPKTPPTISEGGICPK